MTRYAFLAPEPADDVEPGPVPSFSVLVRAHQAAGTIGEAIASALAQTVPPDEVIVWDDGSTDDLEGALAPYRERITLLGAEERRGGAAALNAAAAAASGDFLAVLDADDAYLPERLEALGRLGAARPDLDLLASDAVFEQEGRPLGRFHEHTPFPVAGQRAAILERCFLVGPAVRRAAFEAAGGCDESLETGHDWDCWIRLLLGGACAGLVDAPLLRYRMQPGSLTADRPAVLRGRVRVLEKTAADRRLSPAEHDLLVRLLAAQRRRALLAEARAALRDRAAEARPRSLAVARTRGFGLGTRLKAGAAALSPALAGRLLAARPARGEKERFPG